MKQIALFERNLGIEKVQRNAGDEWMAKAAAMFKDFLKLLPDGRKFMIEQIRAYASERGLSAPHSERAWGAVTMRMARDGYITRWGYSQVSNPTAHMANATVWKKKRKLKVN